MEEPLRKGIQKTRPTGRLSLYFCSLFTNLSSQAKELVVPSLRHVRFQHPDVRQKVGIFHFERLLLAIEDAGLTLDAGALKNGKLICPADTSQRTNPHALAASDARCFV